jgi:hypothetical protein
VREARCGCGFFLFIFLDSSLRSNQVQDLPWSEISEPVARAAKSLPRIALTFAAHIFCTPPEETAVGG